MRQRIAIVVVMLIVLGSAAPAAAGGWATVVLDPSPAVARSTVPWSVGFTVMRHGVTPMTVDAVHLDARHRETGESVTADARQQGAVGHYVVEVAFPRAGAWKWSITPEPFSATSFEALTVLDASADDPSATIGDPAAVHPANLHHGTCASPGETAFSLTAVGIPPAAPVTPSAHLETIGAASAIPVSTSTTTVGASLSELTDNSYAIDIKKSSYDLDVDVACGDIGGQMVDGDLVVSLQQRHNAGDVGVLLLHPVDAGRTRITIMMIVIEGQPVTSGPTTTVAIVEQSTGWQFEPAEVEIPVGGTVTWENRTGDVHTITGDDLAFADSGLIGLNQSYAQTFTEPGVYHYRCGPHPWMTGTVIVH